MKLIVVINLIFCQFLFSQNLIPYNDNGVFGLCDYTGKVILKPNFTNINFYDDNIKGYSTQQNDKYGLLDDQLNVVFNNISIKPIQRIGNQYIIYETKNEASYYSENPLNLIKKNKINNSEQPFNGSVISNNELLQLPSREYVLEEFVKLFKIKNRNEYNIVGANNTYFQIEKENKVIAIYLPITKTFFESKLNEKIYGVQWISNLKQYFIVIKKQNNLGVINNNNQIIIPFFKYKKLFLQKNYIQILNENDSKEVYFINSKEKIVDNFDDFRYSKTLTINNRKFDVFIARIDNISQHDSQNIYIGENGVKYTKIGN